ncbi:MAG TPA: 4'-phosphopantetheinyl transferase superfamily protein, partial [Clostridia bacterium]|nr:4'-phosphopantetheinyl transferase superfamily protein [Clostridia bacterium]
MLLCCHIEYDPGLLMRAMALSLPERRKKALSIHNESVRAASLAAGLLLKHGLHQCGIPEAHILYTEKGKPYLDDGSLCFSLSHSGEYAACAIDKKVVGVDIQKIVSVSQRAVSRFCTTSELAYLDGSLNYHRDVIRLWALKESWLKAAEKSSADMFNASFALHADGTVGGPDGFE